MDLVPVITAVTTFVTGLVGAVVLLLREIRRTPKQVSQVHTLVSILRRVRDWCETEELWEKLPPSLQRDITRVLDYADQQLEDEHGEGDEDGRPRRVRK